MTRVAEVFDQEKKLEELIKKVRFVEYSSEEEEAIIKWIINQESTRNEKDLPR